MKTFADDTDSGSGYTGQLQDQISETERALPVKQASQGNGKAGQTGKYTRFAPYATLFAMLCAVLLMDAILPLRDLWFHESTLTQMGLWPVEPTLTLFPGWAVIPPIPQAHVAGTPDILPSWGVVGLLFGSFVTVFLVYIFALRRLPARISGRFVLASTLILGLLFLSIPVVTSPDLYSYIAYARIDIFRGLNPLTTIPRVLHNDTIYNYVEWVDQPSAYGPVWTQLTVFFQWVFEMLGLSNFAMPMVLTLRSWGLLMHLGSVALIWSISGSLQRLHGIVSQEKRMRATLAFAWNPLLLLEACTNAHNDTMLLFLILAAIWFLVRAQLRSDPRQTTRWISWLNPTVRARILYLAPVVFMALGTCLKINLALLAPGLFFYQWQQASDLPIRQRLKRVGASIALYGGLIIGLFAPFWQGGALLHLLQVNPGAYRNINTLPDTLGHLYNGIAATIGFPLAAPIGSPAEHFFHTLSMGIFVLLYLGLCWQALRTPNQMHSIHGLVRWLAITWLLYCGIGAPWFWPWYMITFFGLYALFEAAKPAQVYLEEGNFGPKIGPFSLSQLFKQFQALLLQPIVVRGLAFSMFTLYCFTAWAPQHSFVPFLPDFTWSYLSGVWVWILPIFFFYRARKGSRRV